METKSKTEYLSATELLALAKTSYSKKSYEDSRDYLLAARQSCSHTMEMDILDYLAAVQEKLERFDKAIRFGKEMVQLDSSNARGYLRIGRSLQKSGNSSYETKILPIYERGVEKVSSSDANLDLLKKLRDAYLKKTFHLKASDPMGALPLELIFEILSYFSFPEIVTCTGVSKGWRNLLSSFPPLWREMDLTTAKQGKGFVTQTAVKHFIRWSNYSLKVAKLGRFDHFATMLNMLDCCKDIHTLSIDARSSTVRSNLVRICQKAKNLRSFTCTEVQSIEDVNRIMNNLSHVEEIYMENLSWDGDASRYRTFPPPNLKYDKLKIFKMDFKPRSHPDISGSYMTPPSINTPRFVSDFLMVAPLLDKLVLTCVSFTEYPNWTTCSKLRTLELDHCSFNRGGDVILPPSLESLKLSYTTGIRPTTIGSEFPDELPLPNLTKLHFEHCQWGPDMVEMLLSGWTQSERDSAVLLPRPQEAKANLKVLKILGCYWNSLPTARQIFRMVNNFDEVLTHPRLAGLETLVLGSPEVGNDTLDIVSKNCGKLKRIGLVDGTVTGVGIKNLVSCLPDLKQLALTDCDKVAEDSYDWVRARGVKIWNLRGKSASDTRVDNFN